jgi:hypothetical protein
MIDTEELAETMAEGWDEDQGAFEEDVDDSDLFHDIYVETASSIIHEVQMFADFCLVRPASPNMYAGIRKLSMVQFSGEFHEYCGDHEAVRAYLRNAGADFIVET